PIYFENSEGNLGLANAVLEHLASKLTVSRLQRDLSDSTVLRNQGVGLGYSILAIKSTLNGLSRLEVDKQKVSGELKNHWELLAEPIQVVLRKEGYSKPYEALKSLTRGQTITKTDLHKFIKSLKIGKIAKDQLLKLTPENYLGLAGKLVDKYLK
ncbi:MAG TPA: adenylosuccinate lyase, partial [Patescibacteria group bacterium]|nr:adenylosuccinate lyase [Patescibacteria group bacterium]